MNIGLHKQSLDHFNYNYMGKMSPLAFHKLQNTNSRVEPTPSTMTGAKHAGGEGTAQRTCRQGLGSVTRL